MNYASFTFQTQASCQIKVLVSSSPKKILFIYALKTAMARTSFVIEMRLKSGKLGGISGKVKRWQLVSAEFIGNDDNKKARLLNGKKLIDRAM